MDARCHPEFLPRAALAGQPEAASAPGPRTLGSPFLSDGAREARGAGGRGCSHIPAPHPSCTRSLEPLGAGWSRRPAANTTLNSPFRGRPASWVSKKGPSRTALGTGLGTAPWLCLFFIIIMFKSHTEQYHRPGNRKDGFFSRKPFYYFWKCSGRQHTRPLGLVLWQRTRPYPAVGVGVSLSPPPHVENFWKMIV